VIFVRVERARPLIAHVHALGEDAAQMTARMRASFDAVLARRDPSFQHFARSVYHCAHRDGSTRNLASTVVRRASTAKSICGVPADSARIHGCPTEHPGGHIQESPSLLLTTSHRWMHLTMFNNFVT
jgi:hypothetical protein